MSLRERLRKKTGANYLVAVTVNDAVEVVREWLQQKIDDCGDVVIHSMHDNVKGKIAAQSVKHTYEKLLEELEPNE